MKKKIIRIIGIVLVFSLLISSVFMGFATNQDIDRTPVIVVPGIMQSQVYVQDHNGHDQLTVDGFPIVEGMDFEFLFDSKQVESDIKSKMLLPTLKSLLTGNRDYFINQVISIANDSMKYHYFNPDGTRCYDAKVDEYWYSLAESKNHPEKSYNYAKGYDKDENGNTLPTTRYKTEYDFIMRQVDLTSFAEKVGYDRIYYFAYSSFGDTFEIAKKLNDYIQMVKQQTGSDKVNLAFISLGGTIGNVYLAKYCNPDDINRVVFAAAAVDGSDLLGDMMKGDLTLDDPKALYNDVLPNMLKLISQDNLWLGYLGNILIRLLPNKVFSDFMTELAKRVLDEVAGNIMYNCPSMWALVPSDDYKELSEKLISDPAHAALKAKTDAYYEIQKNASERIKQYVADGMDIFVICGYNLQLPGLIDSYAVSSDNIIQSTSTSLGAVFALAGEKLPEDYVPTIDESYISPDRNVDAGAAALPDRTWFVKNQSHLKLQLAINDTIELCVQILTNKNITDSRVNNGGYPQFNNYRNLVPLKYNLHIIEKLTSQQLDSYSADTRAKLQAVYDAGQNVLKQKNWDDSYKSVEEQLETLLSSLGLVFENSKESSKSDSKITVTKFLSDLLNKTYGARDFFPFF